MERLGVIVSEIFEILISNETHLHEAGEGAYKQTYL